MARWLRFCRYNIRCIRLCNDRIDAVDANFDTSLGLIDFCVEVFQG